MNRYKYFEIMEELTKFLEFVQGMGYETKELTFPQCVTLHQRVTRAIKHYLKNDEDETQEQEQGA